MFKEHDSVILKRLNPKVPLPVGSRGAIVIIYDAHPAMYEVEFFDDEGDTVGLHTVAGDDLSADPPASGYCAAHRTTRSLKERCE